MYVSRSVCVEVGGSRGYHTGTLSNTIIHLAERVAGAAVANGRASADEISKRNEVVPVHVEVLREAGGTVISLSREEWLEQQNDMEIDDEN
jgi:hypothetical protein